MPFPSQAAGDDNMTVTLTLSYKDTQKARTSGHKWHVHLRSPVNQAACDTAGGHYDPTSAEAASDYHCNASAPADCYAGDLSGVLCACAVSRPNAHANTTDVRTYVHTYIHTNIHIHIHIYIYIKTLTKLYSHTYPHTHIRRANVLQT